jgi:two-component system, cell cycle sensor histidine kinase and response regulator CckA
LRLNNLDLEIANRRLKMRTVELQSSRETFRNIVDMHADGIAVVDAHSLIRFANPAFGRLLGVSQEAIVGLEFPFPLQCEKVLSLEPGEWESMPVPTELFLSETKWNQESAFIATLRDVSSRRKTEAALRASEDMLRQAQRLESIGRLAGGVAHDFNNLLTTINGYTELVLRSVERENPVRAHLEEIRHAGDRAASLTQQLLAYSRKQILVPKPLNLNQVVDSMLNMLERMIGDDVELESRLDPQLGLILVDPGQLEQMIMNLVVNAKDSMPQGGRILLETGMRTLESDSAFVQGIENDLPVSPGAYAVLGVTDTGSGMDESIRQRIFEPFFTTKEVGKGTGLGLSTVYGFLKQSGGNITVNSEPGKGSTFQVFLPLVRDREVWEEPVNAETKEMTGCETVLLVEDHHILRKYLSMVLKQAGYDVLEAGNGHEALAVSHGQVDQTIHLLITDVMMPKMGGIELAAKLGEDRPNMKTLLISGFSEELALDSLGIEAVNFLQKPFTQDQLFRKVHEVLATKAEEPGRG